MGKFGKKNNVDLNPLHYNICLLGESGIGKSSISKAVCEKLVGDDGYIHFDIGREDGAAAIQGIVSEKIEDWAKLKEVVDDIIENKTTDYPNLKVIVWDTFDELVPLAEAEAIRLYNIKNPDKKADTILSAWGGFGRGQDKALELILDKIWELKRVGINPFIIGHVKRTDILDPVTQETYSKLTADSTQRYFNGIKNKMHFIGMGYIDRDIVKEKTGRKDVKGNDIKISKITNESRVINFRDDTYSVDSKSRFADIVDQIPFDADEFIKAMQDAIRAERTKSGETIEEATADQAVRDKAAEQSAVEYSAKRKEDHIDTDRNTQLVADIRAKFVGATEDEKKAIRDYVSKHDLEGISESLPTVHLEAIYSLLG